MKKNALLPLIISLFFPCACTSSEVPSTLYALHAITSEKKMEKIPYIVSVAEPEVPPGFDSEKIALYLNGGRRMDYYAGMAWPERLGKLLQDVIVQSAYSAADLIAVTPDSGIAAAYNLIVKVNDFEPVYAEGPEKPPRLRVSMTFRLISLRTQKMLINTTITEETMAAENTQTAIVSGLEFLLHKIIRRALGRISHI